VDQITNHVLTLADGLLTNLEDRMIDTDQKCDEQPPVKVVWDEEMSTNIVMHSGLLQQLAFGSKSTNDTTRQPNQSDINTQEGLLEQLALGEGYRDDELVQGVGSEDSLFELIAHGERSVCMDSKPIAKPISCKASVATKDVLEESFDESPVWADDPQYDTEPMDDMNLDVAHVVELLTKDFQNLAEEIIEVLINDAFWGDQPADTITQVAADIISIPYAFSLGDILPLGNTDDVQVVSIVNRNSCDLAHFGVLVLQHDPIAVGHPMFDDIWQRRALSPWKSWKLWDHLVFIMMFPRHHYGFNPSSGVHRVLLTSTVEIAQGIDDQMHCEQIDFKTYVLSECDALTVQ
jgi:hypothetical protein